MKITQLHALRVRIPQKPPIAPYQSRYRATSAKEALLVRLETDTGLVGWGETPVDWIDKSFEGECPKEEKACLALRTKQNAIHAVDDLKERSSIIKKAIDEHKLAVVIGYYELKSGKVVVWKTINN